LQILVALVAGGALAGAGAISASASNSRAAVGAAQALPDGARLLGALPASNSLRLTIAMQPQDPAGLMQEAGAVSTPGSPQFRHYLTVSEFAQTYGATPAQIDAVSSALRAQGLTVGAPASNDLSLPISGTTAEVEHAFATPISQVKLAGGRTAYANTVAPTLAPDIAQHVQDVVGLSNVTLEHAHPVMRPHGARAIPGVVSHVATGGPAPSCSGPGTGGGYTANTIASAYQFSPLYAAGDLGAGQTVAVYELESYSPADIDAYQSCYGTSTPVVPVSVDGGGTYAGGDDTEAALDIEQVIGLAPQATIRVYTAPNGGAGPYEAYSMIATDNIAKVVSSSWGLCEPQVAADSYAYAKAEDNLFAEMATQGQGVFVASGDSGSAACAESDPTNQVLSIVDPANAPYATGVGGTTLYTVSSGKVAPWSPGQPLDEAVWNEGAPSGVADATGGGVSSIWGMPAYQLGAARGLGVINAQSSGADCAAASPGSTYCREEPDVSADGDPYFAYAVHITDSGGSRWAAIGGTSASTPLWAALMALTNAQASCRGKTIGFANPSLYALAGVDYRAYFRDVALANPGTGAGDNDALGVNGGLYPVTAGYDMATGLGAPVGSALASGLCSLRAPVYTISYGVRTQISPRGRKLTLKTHASDSGGVPVIYTALGLPAGLKLNALTGVIGGTPTTNGVSSVTITAQDDYANVASSRFNWAIVPIGRPQAVGVKLTGVAKRRPRLRFTMHAGVFAAPLKSVSVSLPTGLSFTRRGRAVTKGLLVKVGKGRVKYRARVSHGVLTIILRHAAGEVFASIGVPTLSAGAVFAAKARRHKIKRVRVGLSAIDSKRELTKLKFELRLRS
jgi:subtilase family serine protease